MLLIVGKLTVKGDQSSDSARIVGFIHSSKLCMKSYTWNTHVLMTRKIGQVSN